MQTARLENWTFDGRSLWGDVFDHPKIGDGEFVRTSGVTDLNVDEGYAVTRNTRYTLGNILSKTGSRVVKEVD